MRFKPLKILIASYRFSITVGELISANVSDCVHFPWPWHKRRHAKTKVARNEALTVKL